MKASAPVASVLPISVVCALVTSDHPAQQSAATEESVALPMPAQAHFALGGGGGAVAEPCPGGGPGLLLDAVECVLGVVTARNGPAEGVAARLGGPAQHGRVAAGHVRPAVAVVSGGEVRGVPDPGARELRRVGEEGRLADGVGEGLVGGAEDGGRSGRADEDVPWAR